MQEKCPILTQFRAPFFFVLKIAIYATLTFSFLLTLQCTIKKPTAPSWNTKLTIPLTSKHYDIPTLIDKINDPHLKVDSLGNPYFYFADKLDTIEVRENLVISPVSKNFNDTLGAIELNPTETSDNTVNLADIYPWGAGALPDTDFNVLLEVETVDFFTQATVQSGTATMIVENQLGVDFDSVVINVVDTVTSTIVATFIFPDGILDTETDSQTAALSPQTIYNQLYYDVYAHTPGDTIFTTSDKYMHLKLSINDVVVSQGVAKIPEISLEKNDTIAFAPSEVIVDSATIKSGNILLNLNNFSNLEADVQVRLPDFTSNGQALTINRTIAGGGVTAVNVPLDGYDFTPQVNQALRVEVSALTESSGTELVSFNSSDSIRLDASTSEIKFSRISGTIPQTSIDIDTMQRELNLPEGFENTQLTNALLEIRISNGVNLPIDFSILIKGDNGKELNLNGHSESGSATSPTRAVIVDSNLSQFLDPIPQQISITGIALCGEETNQTTITENDFVFAEVRIISPLQFVMGASDVKIDSTSHQLNDDVQDLLSNKLNWGKIVLNATNHLPLGASIELYVSANQENLYTNPDLTIGPFSVSSGSIGEDGLVEEASVSSNVVQLSSEDIEVFKNKPFYIGGNLHLPGTNGEEVKAIGSDYLDVTAYLELEINNGD
ncbi:MAG: hypothetical protein MUO85_10355 [candidate division Zixibacteria bacterium]|nr:hypothetical protein [candidate division Zixibacteria bacterium]